MWRGIQEITDYKATQPPPPHESNIYFLNALNNYFGRLEALSTIPVRKSIPRPNEQTLFLDTADVQRTLRRVNASGPNNIPGGVCADRLAVVITDIFNNSETGSCPIMPEDHHAQKAHDLPTQPLPHCSTLPNHDEVL